VVDTKFRRSSRHEEQMHHFSKYTNQLGKTSGFWREYLVTQHANSRQGVRGTEPLMRARICARVRTADQGGKVFRVGTACVGVWSVIDCSLGKLQPNTQLSHAAAEDKFGSQLWLRRANEQLESSSE